MALQIDDSGILTALTADLATAWGVQRIHLSPPMLPGDSDSLPRAFVRTQEVAFNGEGAGLRQVGYRIDYEITLQAKLPTGGAVLYDVKKEKANALLALLTADDVAFRYGGEHYLHEEIRWLPDGPEEADTAEDLYLTSLVFPVLRIVTF